MTRQTGPSDARATQSDVDAVLARRRVVLAGGIGSAVEFYDFGVYGYLATTTASLFFPQSSPGAALLATLAVFATAFVVRPVGSILFGHVGDRVGRRPALAISVIAMALATFSIGLLPTAAAIGSAAPVLLVIARLVQGLSAGGELGGAATMLAEASVDRHRGLICSVAQIGALSGLLLASGIVSLTDFLIPPGDMQAWGWRIPFLLALPTGIVGLLIRRRLDEGTAFKRIVDEGAVAQVPIVQAFRVNSTSILKTLGICVMVFVGYYMVFVYLTIHLQQQAFMSRAAANWSTGLTILVAIIMLPVFGLLSDRVGRRPVIAGSAVGLLVLPLPLFGLINGGSVGLAVFAQVLLGICVAAIMGVLWAAIVEMFPTAVRYSGVGFAYSLAAALVGGTTPYIAAWLTQVTGNTDAPAYLLMASSVVALLTLLTMRETSGRGLVA